MRIARRRSAVRRFAALFSVSVLDLCDYHSNDFEIVGVTIGFAIVRRNHLSTVPI